MIETDYFKYDIRLKVTDTNTISNQNALIFNKPSNKIPIIFILKSSEM